MAGEMVRIPDEDVQRLAKEHGPESVIARVAQVYNRPIVGATYGTRALRFLRHHAIDYGAPEGTASGLRKNSEPKRDSHGRAGEMSFRNAFMTWGGGEAVRRGP